jgi:hypothetical protein
VRLASEQAARRAQEEMIEEEMHKVVVKSLDDGGSVKAMELTASPIIGSAELMKKQASHMQVLAVLILPACLNMLTCCCTGHHSRGEPPG